MNGTEFNKIVDDTLNTCKDIMVVKGQEYAHGDDRLDNFKRNARDLDTAALLVWAVYFRKHLDSITTYVKDQRDGTERLRSESILGRFDDAINYLLLGKALVIEAEQVKHDHQQLRQSISSVSQQEKQQ